MKHLRYLTAALCLFAAPAASLAQPDANYVKTASMLDSVQRMPTSSINPMGTA